MGFSAVPQHVRALHSLNRRLIAVRGNKVEVPTFLYFVGNGAGNPFGGKLQ
jgi:hypothetical protein